MGTVETKGDDRGSKIGLSLGTILLAVTPLPLLSGCVESTSVPEDPAAERIEGEITSKMASRDFSSFHAKDPQLETLIRSFERAYSTLDVALVTSHNETLTNRNNSTDPGPYSPAIVDGVELIKGLYAAKVAILESLESDSINAYHGNLSTTVQLLETNIGLIESGDFHGSFREASGEASIGFSSTQVPAFMLKGQLEFMIHLFAKN